MKNYYQILNIRPTATEDEIKRSYRVLAKRYHPDVNPGDETAADRFADINEAHNVLIDPKTRAEYDQKLKESQAPRQRPEDIIARQRAAAQAAARQAAMRNAYAASGMGRSAYSRAAQAAAAQAQAAAAAQAQAQAAQAQNMQSQIAQIKNQAYKQGYDKGASEGRAALERAELKHKQKVVSLEREVETLKDRLAEIENDRSDLEQELFNRDRELTQSQQQNRELEDQIRELEKQAELLKQNVKKSLRAAAARDEATAVKAQLDKAKTRIAALEAEKREIQLKNQAQIALQQDKRRELQAEIDELHRQVESLTEEVEVLRSDNEQWQQYAKSEDFISDAEQRLQEWDKKQKADKKLAKGTLYGSLGVLIWADATEIDAAFAKLEKRYSRGTDDASAEKLQKLKDAYAVLSDPDKRREYNESIGITDERIEEERFAIDENNRLEEEYRKQLESKEFWEEFDDLTFNAQTGDAEAQNRLGEMYYYGDEIEQDIEQAVYWFKEAAKQKHADAMYNLGLCFINGEGVERNETTGMGFIRQAAKLGSKEAMSFKFDG